MKRWMVACLLLGLLLAACQDGEPAEPTESARPEPSADPSGTVAPDGQTAPSPPETPETLPFVPTPVPLPTPPAGFSPRPAVEGTLGELAPACVGHDLRWVASDRVYATGWQIVQDDSGLAERPCASIIDLATGEISSWDLPVAGPIVSDGQTFYTGGSVDGERFVLVSLPYGEGVIEAPLTGPVDEVVLVAGNAVVLSEGTAHVFSLSQGGQIAQIPGVQAVAAWAGLADQAPWLAMAGRTVNDQLFVGLYDPADPAKEPLLYRDSLPPGSGVLALALDPGAERLALARDAGGGQAGYGLDLLALDDLSTVTVLELDSLADIAVDPAWGRLYAAGDQVLAFDLESGQELDSVLSVPRGEPEGFVSPERLRLDPSSGRLYLSYVGFDGDQWLAMANPDGERSVVDLPLPAGPWALTPEGNVLAADEQTLVLLDGECVCRDPTRPCPPCPPQRRVSLTRRPQQAQVSSTDARLFVTDGGGDLHILSALSLEEVGRLRGVGGYVSLDPSLNQLYVGDRYSGGIHVFDLTLLSQAPEESLNDLEPIGFIPQPGRPIASPADGLIYILEESVYRANGDSLDLLTWRTTRDDGCTGCPSPTDVIVDPNTGLTATTIRYEQAGKPGHAQQAAVDPKSGRAFVATTSGGYQPVYRLFVFPDLNLTGAERWIDGLYGPLSYNPVSDQLYLLAGGRRLLRLTGGGLELLGSVDLEAESRGLTLDPVTGRFYLAQGWQVTILDESAESPPPEPVSGLPNFINSIVPAPNFAESRTLFASAYDAEIDAVFLYRSTNDGVGWERIRGGLPFVPSDLAWGPDGTIYAAMGQANWRAWPQYATWGEGVYRSRDGGQTWQPDNAGLAHLRVTRLGADEENLYALSASTLDPSSNVSGPTVWGRPFSPSLEITGTLGWGRVEVPDTEPLGTVSPDGLYTYTQQVQAWWHALQDRPLYQGVGADLERSDDNGLTWEVVGSGPSETVLTVQAGLDNRTVYWVDAETLWRSTNGGRSWAALRHPGLAAGPPSVVTVADVEGAETLFLGTPDGRVLILPADEAEWE